MKVCCGSDGRSVETGSEKEGVIVRETTLCYLKRGGCWLMLHRTKKKNDQNGGKWIGVGGKLEPGESPEDCAAREIREETGLIAEELHLRSVITFLSDEYEPERMYLFTTNRFHGDTIVCDEGDLAWIPVDDVMSLPTWEGDRLFLEKIRDSEEGYFSLKLRYEGDQLVQAEMWEHGRRTVIR